MTLPYIGFDPNLTYFEHNLKSTGIPNVFIHGVGLDNTMWLPQKKIFQNSQLVFYDLLNHGNSKKNHKELTFKDFVLQLELLLKYLKINKCNLIGFSIGALIAQHFAVKNTKKLNKLILIGSVFQRNKDQIALVKNRFEQVKKGNDIVNSAIRRWFNSDYIKKNPDIINLFTGSMKLRVTFSSISQEKSFYL